MSDLGWSGSEKKFARRAFEEALDVALANVMTEFKAKAAAAATPDDMWAIEDYLRESRRDIDQVFDYRYSQLLLVFARLIDAGYMDETRLGGLSEEKREIIRRILSLR